MALQGIPTFSAPRFSGVAAPARFGAEPEKPQAGSPDETPNEPGFFEQAESLMARLKEFVTLFSEVVKSTRRGVLDAAGVLRKLPQWEETLTAADPAEKNTAVDRLKSVLDVAMAEFRKSYTDPGDDDFANFALYNGVLNRFPRLALMEDNALAQRVLDGALATNPFRPEADAREALDELKETLSELAEETGGEDAFTPDLPSLLDEVLGIPKDVTNVSGSFEEDA